MTINANRTFVVAVALVLAQILPAAAVARAVPEAGANNEILLSGSSPFEDLTEFAISADKAAVTRALRQYGRLAAQLEQALPPTRRDTFNALVAEIQQAAHRDAYRVIALKSPEAYRVLIGSLDRRALKVPVEVSLLDYVGFRFLALLHARPGDWPALTAAADDAHRHWNAIKSSLTDPALREAIDITIAGLVKSCAVKNADMALFAAQVDLAQVDLLEAYFENKRRR